METRPNENMWAVVERFLPEARSFDAPDVADTVLEWCERHEPELFDRWTRAAARVRMFGLVHEVRQQRGRAVSAQVRADVDADQARRAREPAKPAVKKTPTPAAPAP